MTDNEVRVRILEFAGRSLPSTIKDISLRILEEERIKLSRQLQVALLELSNQGDIEITSAWQLVTTSLSAKALKKYKNGKP